MGSDVSGVQNHLEQLAVVACQGHELATASGANRFEFRLPEGPWSLDGELVRIAWGIEAILLPAQENAHVFFWVGAGEARPPA